MWFGVVCLCLGLCASAKCSLDSNHTYQRIRFILTHPYVRPFKAISCKLNLIWACWANDNLTCKLQWFFGSLFNIPTQTNVVRRASEWCISKLRCICLYVSVLLFDGSEPVKLFTDVYRRRSLHTQHRQSAPPPPPLHTYTFGRCSCLICSVQNKPASRGTSSQYTHAHTNS